MREAMREIFPEKKPTLPPVPVHGFVGREQELAEATRTLETSPFLIVRGEHGEGKTAFAVELGRRLLTSGTFRHVAHIDLRTRQDVRGVRFALGERLVPQYVLAMAQGSRFAGQLLEKVLREQPTLVVLDHCEAVLPTESTGAGRVEPEHVEKLLILAREAARIGRTRLVLVSRSALPEDLEWPELELAGLPTGDGVALIGAVLERAAEPVPAWPSAAELSPLAEAVEGHAGALLALAGEIVANGVDGAAAALREIVEDLGNAPEDDRRQALQIGVELALRRLSPELRQKARPLAVFRGGGHLTAIAAVLSLDVENDEEILLAEALIDARLAEMTPNNFLRLHPALAEVLRTKIDEGELVAARTAWLRAESQLIAFLYQEQVKSPQLVSGLALLELPNLLACLEYLTAHEEPEAAIELAGEVEGLIGPLGRPAALARVEALRVEATERLGEWSREQFLRESAVLEAQMDAGHPEAAAAAARKLIQRVEAIGESAYDGVEHDLATTHLTLGLAELLAGENDAARNSLVGARERFQRLAAAGDAAAARMEPLVLARIGDAERAVGRLDEAARIYERAIARSKRLDDERQTAEIESQLGSLYLAQGRPGDALEAYSSARAALAELGEPLREADIHHRLAAVHEAMGDPDAAEAAYRAALELEGAAGERSAVAVTLGELGAVQASAGRIEEAAEAFARAAELFAELGDLANEGIARSQLANQWMRLERHDEARDELLRTVECDRPLGHAAEPWRTYSMLFHLETGVGEARAARVAREKAVEAYLAYRRDGGENQTHHDEIFTEVVSAIEHAVLEHGATDEVRSRLAGMKRRPDLPPTLAALIPALEALLDGSRDRALASDPNLYYRDAAELLLQIEKLEDREQPLAF